MFVKYYCFTTIVFSTHDKPYEEETERKTMLCCLFDWQVYCRYRSINCIFIIS